MRRAYVVLTNELLTAVLREHVPGFEHIERIVDIRQQRFEGDVIEIMVDDPQATSLGENERVPLRTTLALRDLPGLLKGGR